MMNEPGIFEYYVKCFKEYANFNGRARRKEYWSFVLLNILTISAISIFFASMTAITQSPVIASIGVVCYSLYGLIVLIPHLAVMVRRLHDLGKSGWLVCVAFIPLVGSIILLIWLFTEGTSGDNPYGEDPKSHLR